MIESPPAVSRRIDAHVHLQGPDALRSLRSAGIAAARDAGTKNGAGLELLKESGTPLQPVIQSAGRALFRKGGYGGLFGRGLESDEEIRAEIRTLHKAGAGIIKVMASGIVSLAEPGRITAGGFNAEQLRMIVSEAGARGLGVMAHANGEAAILACAAAGVRSVEHGFFMTERALDELARRGIWWVPTAGALDRAAAGTKTTSDAKRYIHGLITLHLTMIRKARERSVRLAVGTDAVLPDPRYGQYYDAELEFFRKADVPDNEVAGIACVSSRELLDAK